MIESLITEAANRARLVIKANLHALEILKNRLLEKETVDAAEVLDALKALNFQPPLFILVREWNRRASAS